MQDMQRPAMSADGRNRTVEEARILDYLLLCGWAREARHGDRAPAEREARTALDRWVGFGLPFVRSADGERRFDPAEVVNMLKWTGAQHGDPFWEERFIATGRALIRAFHRSPPAQGAPPPPATLAPTRFEFTLQREFALQYFGSGARTTLRMPLPLEDHSLQGLTVECIGPPDVDVDFALAPGRLDARFATPPAPTITLSTRMSFTVGPGVPEPRAVPLSRTERELYTRPTEGLVRIGPRIAALAARLTGGERNAWTAATNFWNFVRDELTWGVVDYHLLDAARPLDHVLEAGWYDCQLGSALLVALCRACGIPARIVSGYLLYPASPSYHWWAEVWLDDRGWVPLDTIGSDLSARGRDESWRDYFLGQVDYRMKSEILPRFFNRSPGLHLPAAWRMLSRADGEATEVGLFASATGEPVYRDRIVVRHEAGASRNAGGSGAAASSVNASPL